MKRPSHKELTRKIAQAKKAVLHGCIKFVDPTIIASEALELGYLVKDITNILPEILDEIEPKNYAGTRPPQRSYENKIRDFDLFAFGWKSKYFGCELYLKFTLKEKVLWLVSLHPDRKGRSDKDEK